MSGVQQLSMFQLAQSARFLIRGQNTLSERRLMQTLADRRGDIYALLDIGFTN